MLRLLFLWLADCCTSNMQREIIKAQRKLDIVREANKMMKEAVEGAEERALKARQKVKEGSDAKPYH